MEKVLNGRIIVEKMSINFFMFIVYVFVVFKFFGFCKGVWRLFYVDFVVSSKVGMLNGMNVSIILIGVIYGVIYGVILFGIFVFGISEFLF